MIHHADCSSDQIHMFRTVLKGDKRFGGTVLQVGARGEGALTLFDGFSMLGCRGFDVLEVWEPNVQWARKQRMVRKAVLGDVRRIGEIEELDEKYGVIAWHHGPEHVSKEEFTNCLSAIMDKCERAFWVGMPWGIWEQGDLKGNPNEKHLSAWLPEELEALGFEVWTLRLDSKPPGPDNHNVLVGVKFKEKS